MTHCPVCDGTLEGKWKGYNTCENTVFGCPGWRIHGPDEHRSIAEMKRAWAQIREGTQEPTYPPKYRVQAAFIQPVPTRLAMFPTTPQQHGAPWRTCKANPSSRGSSEKPPQGRKKVYEEDAASSVRTQKASRSNATAALPTVAPSQCPEQANDGMMTPERFLRQVMPGPVVFAAFTREQVLELLQHYPCTEQDEDP